MNKLYYNVLLSIKDCGFTNQRQLVNATKFSLGFINKALKKLKEEKYLDRDNRLTNKANDLIIKNKPKNAIILAAGVGMRMAPINNLVPKAFLEVNNEPLIERLIKQLKEVGIDDITVVVGFMKEHFDYLIDEYGVNLIVNSDYYSKNNLHSLSLVADRIDETYIIPCDLYCYKNPFNESELYSWYMVSEDKIDNTDVSVNRKQELVRKKINKQGNRMIGIAYITSDSSSYVKKQIIEYSKSNKYNDCFWEEALYDSNKMVVQAKTIKNREIVEINTYEQLRELDNNSDQLKSDAIDIIIQQFNCSREDIKNINILKKGMTNRSFIFSINNKKYIMRIPGEGTDQLINRKEEKDVYDAIAGMGFCDDPIYINSDNGYKITKYIENVRCCNSKSDDDLRKCMRKLRCFHDKKIKVKHEFDIFEKISFYESLWNGESSVYKDYLKTKKNIYELKDFVDNNKCEYQLTHIDAVPDNFLFDPNNKGELSIQLTDWEYSAMQDPHVDIAMFIIYSLYEKEDADKLIDIYFEDTGCSDVVRTKIYCYIAMCGLLWSNWCEYKRQLGIEFGEYSIKQYRYSKDYYKYAKELMNAIGEKNVSR